LTYAITLTVKVGDEIVFLINKTMNNLSYPSKGVSIHGEGNIVLEGFKGCIISEYNFTFDYIWLNFDNVNGSHAYFACKGSFYVSNVTFFTTSVKDIYFSFIYAIECFKIVLSNVSVINFRYNSYWSPIYIGEGFSIDENCLV
jgi:hypothetical protein